MNTFYHTILETEEFVTAEEFLRRRERGEISSFDAQFVPQDPTRTGNFGVFKVKIKAASIPRGFSLYGSMGAPVSNQNFPVSDKNSEELSLFKQQATR